MAGEEQGQVFTPAFTFSHFDSESSRKPPIRIVSVVSSHNKKEKRSETMTTLRKTTWIIILIFFCIHANAQDIFGDWIKIKVSCFDNTELPNNNAVKFQYLRYTFEKNDKLFMSFAFDDKGTLYNFEKKARIVDVKNSYGYVVNSFMISKLSNDELIIVQKGKNGFTDNDCLKYYFIREKDYQNQLPIKSSDILLISKNDTVYKATEKLRAKFLGDKSFYDFCSENIPERDVVMATNNLFLATFIVRKNGLIDSVQVLENINKEFEKQFRKALKKSKKLWLAGELNGNKVDVQMKIKFRFISSDKFLPKYDYSLKGKTAMNNSDFTRALAYFDLALEKVPSDYESLYYKAICEMNLGNKNAACEDLEKVKNFEKMKVDELIEKNCN